MHSESEHKAEVDKDILVRLEADRCNAIIASRGPLLYEFSVLSGNGVYVNVMAGPTDISDYYGDGFEPGQLFVAPFAGRVKGGVYQIGEALSNFPQNNNGNSLHSGGQGSDSRLPEIPASVRITENNSVVMEWKEVGLEGSRYNTSLTFGLLEDGSGYYFETTVNPIDGDMYWNPTTHAYFNLGGSDSDPGDQLLTIPAENILETDDQMIPTGEVVPAGEVDFSTERKTGDSNLDHYFALLDSSWDGLVTRDEFERRIGVGERLARVATLRHPATGIVMDVTSNVFGVQVFNGWEKRVAIEPMTMPPNAINLEQFREGAIARRGQTYVQRTECRFSLSPAENFLIA